MTEPTLFSVFQLGEFPATRDRGREGRDRLDDLLTGKQHIDLTIDFTGVTAMTISFADEFLGKFLTTYEMAEHDATVKVAGLNQENLEAVTILLERREVQVTALSQSGVLRLVGDPMLAETFDVAAELVEFRANDIAEALSLSAQNANNRLKRLVSAGALRKRRSTVPGRGGREFTYVAVTAEIPSPAALNHA